MTNFHNDINADDQFLMHDAIEDARFEGLLRLFVVHLSTKDWSSEYGCMFVVRAEDEDAARTIIDEDVADWYRKGYDLQITEIGFTDATDPAIVSSFRT
jgi:hypothetical protein